VAFLLLIGCAAVFATNMLYNRHLDREMQRAVVLRLSAYGPRNLVASREAREDAGLRHDV
jgi:hypothetical protein